MLCFHWFAWWPRKFLPLSHIKVLYCRKYFRFFHQNLGNALLRCSSSLVTTIVFFSSTTVDLLDVLPVGVFMVLYAVIVLPDCVVAVLSLSCPSCVLLSTLLCHHVLVFWPEVLEPSDSGIDLLIGSPRYICKCPALSGRGLFGM